MLWAVLIPVWSFLALDDRAAAVLGQETKIVHTIDGGNDETDEGTTGGG